MEATKQTSTQKRRSTSSMTIVYRSKTESNAGGETNVNAQENFLSAREQTGMKIIYNHKGKRKVYEFYHRHNPEMAMMYLKFVSKFSWAQYIIWDNSKKRFRISEY